MSNTSTRHYYTDDEVQFMYDNHKTMTASEIANALNVKAGSIRCKLSSLGLVAKKHSVYSEDRQLKLCSKCQEMLPVSYFGTNNGNPRSRCRKCEYNNPELTVATRRTYSKDDNEFLRNFAHEYTYQELADIYEVSTHNIRTKLYGMGLKAKVRQVYSDDRTMKRCSKCDNMFPLEEFENKKSNRIRSSCRSCTYEYHFNRKKEPTMINKPSFEDLIKKSKNGVRYCTICNTVLNSENCMIRFSTSKQSWEVATNCKTCFSVKHKERVLKRIAKRGY